MFRMLTIALLALTIGCGGSGGSKPTVKINGKITLDGKPVGGGVVTFEPTDGKGNAVSAKILDGNYEARVQRGVKLVRISYQKVVRTEPVYPGSANSPLMDVTEEVIPAKYNSASRLEKDLTEPSGSTDFALVSTE